MCASLLVLEWCFLAFLPLNMMAYGNDRCTSPSKLVSSIPVGALQLLYYVLPPSYLVIILNPPEALGLLGAVSNIFVRS